MNEAGVVFSHVHLCLCVSQCVLGTKAENLHTRNLCNMVQIRVVVNPRSD